MSDFILDADPFIPSGVAATVEEVAAFVVDGILSVDKVADLVADQQPDSVSEAVASVVAYRVEAGESASDYLDILAEVAVTVKDVEQVISFRVEEAAVAAAAAEGVVPDVL